MSVLIFLVVAGVLILLAAPFIDYFAPASNYHLVHEHTFGEPVTVLVSGSEILWYFWQSYLYIAIGMGFVLLMTFCFIFAIYKHYAVEIDQEIKDEQNRWKRKNREMDELIEKKEAKLDQINKTREIQIREEVERDIENKRAQINEKERNLLDREIITQQRLNASEAKLARSRDIICDAQEIKEKNEKNMRLKLKQADRLRAQKKSLIVFFEQKKITYQNAPLTYQRLLQLAKEQTNQSKR